MSRRHLMVIGAVAGAVLTVAGAVWIFLLLTTRPEISGFSGASEKCFAVFESPNPGAVFGHRRDIDDQARLNRLQPDDTEDVARLTDDCERARIARTATAGVIAGPLTLIVLGGTVGCAIAARRTSPQPSTEVF